MLVQAANPWSAAISPVSSATRSQSLTATAATTTANAAGTVSISQAARDRLAAESNASTSARTATFDTNQGSVDIDIEAYFQPPPGGFTELPPLLLPSPANIQALGDYVSQEMPGFLAANGIPEAPASVSYDRHGLLQLPADYPYVEQFKAALAEEPALARSMQTAAALTSHQVEMQKSLPFHEEYTAAASSAEAAAVVAKYAWLFADNRPAAQIALQFSADGRMSLSADGKPVIWPSA
ncbi:hypothetical protein [Azonexus sp.]|uniref:hypothetical protein n=1 Tax=Azonexus sp. TaxID=1872668 RepID=UPI0035AD96AD